MVVSSVLATRVRDRGVQVSDVYPSETLAILAQNGSEDSNQSQRRISKPPIISTVLTVVACGCLLALLENPTMEPANLATLENLGQKTIGRNRCNLFNAEIETHFEMSARGYLHSQLTGTVFR